MGNSMSTLMGWAVVLSVAGYYGYRHWEDKQRRELARSAHQRQKHDERQHLQAKRDNKEGKQKRQRLGEHDAPKPKSSMPPPPARSSSSVAASAVDSTDDDELNNREFARQLSSAKQGTKLTSKAKDSTRHRSVKLSRAQEMPISANEDRISVPSSTTGIDADDDQSPAASPAVAPADATGIADMLERPAPGPSVLRLIDTGEVKPKETRAKAPEAVAETKKQRQHRKKNEAAKAAREEAEQERKILMEAQRRTARLAEGRAAKDGSGFMAAQAKKPSVWNSNGVNGGSSRDQPTDDGFLPVQPLDTFEPAVQTDTSKSSAPSAGKSESWMSSLPSEEEQMEMLRDEEVWSMVKTKPRKTKQKDGAPEGIEEPSSANSPPPPVAVAPVQKAKASVDARPPAKPLATNSSFAALEDPDEEEWEV